MRKSIMTVLALFVFGLLAVNGFRSSGKSSDIWRSNIDWQNPSVSQADIEKTAKPVYIFFHTDWCTYCTKMKNDVFVDPRVQNLLNEKFTAIEINPETSGTSNFLGETLTLGETAAKLGVRGYPASLFLSPDGTLIGGQPGYISADMFADIGEYIGDGYYKNYSFGEFQSLPTDRRK